MRVYLSSKLISRPTLERKHFIACAEYDAAASQLFIGSDLPGVSLRCALMAVLDV
jgi:hypothetical protein